jgi:glycogen debranching enzyme
MVQNKIFLENEVSELFENVKYTNLVQEPDSDNGLNNGLNNCLNIYDAVLTSINNEHVFLQTGKVKCVSGYESGSDKLEIEFSNKSDLYKLLKELDKFNIDSICKKSNSWFNKSIPRKNIFEMYKSNVPDLLSDSNDDMYTLELNIPLNKYKKSCIDIYNNHKQNINNVNKGKVVELIIELKGLTFFQTVCYFNFECHQIKVNKEKKITKNKYLFKDTDDSVYTGSNGFNCKRENYTFEKHVNNKPSCTEQHTDATETTETISPSEVNKAPIESDAKEEPDVTAESEVTVESEAMVEPDATIEPDVTVEPEAIVEPEAMVESDTKVESEVNDKDCLNNSDENVKVISINV